ncbi:hypothetical protein Landi51_08844 [Colletotrichum acutatum]
MDVISRVLGRRAVSARQGDLTKDAAGANGRRGRWLRKGISHGMENEDRMDEFDGVMECIGSEERRSSRSLVKVGGGGVGEKEEWLSWDWVGERTVRRSSEEAQPEREREKESEPDPSPDIKPLSTLSPAEAQESRDSGFWSEMVQRDRRRRSQRPWDRFRLTLEEWQWCWMIVSAGQFAVTSVQVQVPDPVQSGFQFPNFQVWSRQVRYRPHHPPSVEYLTVWLGPPNGSLPSLTNTQYSTLAVRKGPWYLHVSGAFALRPDKTFGPVSFEAVLRGQGRWRRTGAQVAHACATWEPHAAAAAAAARTTKERHCIHLDRLLLLRERKRIRTRAWQAVDRGAWWHFSAIWLFCLQLEPTGDRSTMPAINR